MSCGQWFDGETGGWYLSPWVRLPGTGNWNGLRARFDSSEPDDSSSERLRPKLSRASVYGIRTRAESACPDLNGPL